MIEIHNTQIFLESPLSNSTLIYKESAELKHVLFNVLTFDALASISPCVSVVNSPLGEHRLHPTINIKTFTSSDAFTIRSTSCGQTTLLLGCLV